MGSSLADEGRQQLLHVLLVRGLGGLGRFEPALRALNDDTLLSPEAKLALRSEIVERQQAAFALEAPAPDERQPKPRPRTISEAAPSKERAVVAAASCSASTSPSGIAVAASDRVWSSAGPFLAVLVLGSGGAATVWIVMWLARRFVRVLHTRGMQLVLKLLGALFGHRRSLV